MITLNDFLELKIHSLPSNFQLYGEIEIYFINTDDYTLIVIPKWNFSFLWDFKIDSIVNKAELIKVLSRPMAGLDAEELADKILNYFYTFSW